MPDIKFNFGPSIANWNNYANNTPNGTLIADLLDDQGNATGISLAGSDAYSYSAGDRASGAFHGLPEAFWDNIAFESGGDMQFTLGNLGAYVGLSYTLTTAHHSNSARDNDVTFDGNTQQYNSVAGNPAAPLVFTGTISASSMVLDIVRASGTTTTYFQGFTLEISSELNSVTVNADGTVTIVFPEAMNVGAGGNGGFVINAEEGQVTLTPTTSLPASTVNFSVSRPIENHETITSLEYTQPGNGFESDSSGDDLETLSFAGVTNNSKIHRLFEDVSLSTPHTSAGLVVRLLGTNLVDGVAPQTLNPDGSGYIQVNDTGLSSGTYWIVSQSADASLAGIDEWKVN